MLLSILFYLFITIGTINLLHFAIYLIGADIYDTRVFKAKKTRRALTKSVQKPLVSVLIPAYNEEKVIERCLQSVWNNTYENLEIIVINDGSSDATAQKVRSFAAGRGRTYRQTAAHIVRTKNGLKRVWRRGSSPMFRRIKLVEQRNGGKASALNRGLRYHARGELVMTLDADSLIHKRAILNAVSYFEDPSVAGVAANVRIIEEPTVLGLLQRFEHMIGYRSKKLYTVANCELIIGGVASTYRRSVLEQVGYFDDDTATEDIGLSMKIAARGNKKYRLIYASDVAAMTEGVGSFKALLAQRYRWKLGNLQNMVKYRHLTFSNDSKYTKSLSWYRMPMAFLGELLVLLEPVSLAYIGYLSIRFLTPVLFLGAYQVITIYVLFTIWPDEHLSRAGKLKASLYAPILYFVFYLMNIVQFIAAIRCLQNRGKIVHLSQRESTWVSPQRAGKAASFSS